MALNPKIQAWEAENPNKNEKEHEKGQGETSLTRLQCKAYSFRR